MPRLTPTQSTLRSLFARSGNQCAYPGCDHELIDSDSRFVAQVCHIEAAERGGERYNPRQTDEARRHSDNLILLCYRHHVVTNDIKRYSVAKLRQIKLNHEALYSKAPFSINTSNLIRLSAEMDQYWQEVEFANKQGHANPDLALRINTRSSFPHTLRAIRRDLATLMAELDALRQSDDQLPSEIASFLKSLRYNVSRIESIPYWQNPFANRNWETHNLAITNILSQLDVKLRTLELRYYEEYLKARPDDLTTRKRLDRLKRDFLRLAKSAIHAD